MEPIKEVFVPNTLFNPDKNWKEYPLYFELKKTLEAAYSTFRYVIRLINGYIMYRMSDQQCESIPASLSEYLTITREVLNLSSKHLLSNESMLHSSTSPNPNNGYICDDLVENLTKYFLTIISKLSNQHHIIQSNENKLNTTNVVKSEMWELESLQSQLYDHSYMTYNNKVDGIDERLKTVQDQLNEIRRQIVKEQEQINKDKLGRSQRVQQLEMAQVNKEYLMNGGHVQYGNHELIT